MEVNVTIEERVNELFHQQVVVVEKNREMMEDEWRAIGELLAQRAELTAAEEARFLLLQEGTLPRMLGSAGTSIGGDLTLGPGKSLGARAVDRTDALRGQRWPGTERTKTQRLSRAKKLVSVRTQRGKTCRASPGRRGVRPQQREPIRPILPARG
jgi:hypothetical protein